ncbi:uncharacterized protein MYCFIDRAFT_205932 [Pseudocercospora fijiensis CIRAD86]|uniref:Uncharacterized protein n=1 Tax=Pseudocercospora fijiensis (strain CIRAD86) TaxID=383855 RepID=N1QAW3_PSEFD|nr:uncharacterized protein MYCFIDRAFT_205932 [Pseudocercospora fijiensis CIRAD86]EME88187.1 hypothetical protein MYCFIDRAFT_205932 [Pseudocercospora fijiensis CIRAD86]
MPIARNSPVMRVKKRHETTQNEIQKRTQGKSQYGKETSAKTEGQTCCKPLSHWTPSRAHVRRLWIKSEVDAAQRALCQWSVACVAVLSACFNRPFRPSMLVILHAIVRRDIWRQNNLKCVVCGITCMMPEAETAHFIFGLPLHQVVMSPLRF